LLISERPLLDLLPPSTAVPGHSRRNLVGYVVGQTDDV